MLLPFSYNWTVATASAFWIAAFLLYVREYTPILLRPRADDKPD